jgi:hypothetical protein
MVDPQPLPSYLGQGNYQTTRYVRVVGAGVFLAAAGVVVGGAGCILLRLARPVAGGLGMILLAGAVGLTALLAGAAAAEAANRRALKATSFDAAARAYIYGCALTGAVNFAAGVFAIIVILTNGASEGLWLPDLLVVILNSSGMIIAVPRLARLRRLHYTPTLPRVRVSDRP